MADITHNELAAARKAAGLYQYQAAYLLHISGDVISDWETGKTMPTPDQVAAMERLYKAPGLWHGWMRYHYKSFRDRYPDTPDSDGLALTMVNAQCELEDVIEIQQAPIRDALDGKISDKRSFDAYTQQVKEAYIALGELLAKVEMEG